MMMCQLRSYADVVAGLGADVLPAAGRQLRRRDVAVAERGIELVLDIRVLTPQSDTTKPRKYENQTAGISSAPGHAWAAGSCTAVTAAAMP